MVIKIVAAVVAMALMLTYLLPYVIKLQDVALSAVIVIGIAMMLVDLWQSLQSKDD